MSVAQFIRENRVTVARKAPTVLKQKDKPTQVEKDKEKGQLEKGKGKEGRKEGVEEEGAGKEREQRTEKDKGMKRVMAKKGEVKEKLKDSGKDATKGGNQVENTERQKIVFTEKGKLVGQAALLCKDIDQSSPFVFGSGKPKKKKGKKHTKGGEAIKDGEPSEKIDTPAEGPSPDAQERVEQPPSHADSDSDLEMLEEETEQVFKPPGSEAGSEQHQAAGGDNPALDHMDFAIPSLFQEGQLLAADVVASRLQIISTTGQCILALRGMPINCVHSGKQYNNFKNAIKRLEEVAISAHGEERIKALRGWLTALKDIQNACTVEKEKEKEKEKGHEKKGKEEHVDESGATIDDGGAASRSAEGDDNPNISSMKAQTALFYDADVGNEPLNFRDVFLRSRALENLMVSFILVPPRLLSSSGKQARGVEETSTLSTTREAEQSAAGPSEEPGSDQQLALEARTNVDSEAGAVQVLYTEPWEESREVDLHAHMEHRLQLKQQRRVQGSVELTFFKLLINRRYIRVLIDSGSTTNFFSPNGIRKAGLGMKQVELQNPRRTQVGNQEVVTSTHAVKGVRITFDKDRTVTHELNFYVLDKCPFDAVIGLGWLKAHCLRTTGADNQLVVLDAKGNERTFLLDETRESPVTLLSANKFCRTVRRRKEAEFVHIGLVKPLHVPFTSTSVPPTSTVNDQSISDPNTSKPVVITVNSRSDFLSPDEDDPPPEIPANIRLLLDRFPEVLAEPRGVPERPVKHKIEIVEGSVPPKGCVYRMGQGELEELRRQIDDMIDRGWIRPSESEFGAPGTMNTEELLHLANSRQKLLERKAAFFNYDKSKGDHKMTVERLKGLSVTLKEAVREMKLKMEENRQQKHDALLYRSSKAAEVLEAEKVISAEVIALDKRRQALEAELKEVMAAITVATAKHIHIQEEKEQFDVASSNIVAHLAQQEEELAHRIMSHSVEESAVSMWQGFMQDTWALQLICTEERDKRTKDAAQKAMAEFLQIAAKHLKYRQEELTLLYKRLKFCSAELETMRVKSLHVEELGMDTVAANISSGKRRLEEKYLEAEALATKVFGVIESIRREATKYAATVQDGDGKAALETVQEYLASIDKLQAQIKDIDRPEINWEKEDENAKSGSETVSGTTSADKSVENSPAATPRGGGLLSGVLGSLAGSPRSRQEGRQLQSPRGDGDAAASSSHATEGSTAAAAGGADSDEQDDDSFKDVENDSEAGTELAKGHLGEDASTREEISGWEFDELGQEPDVPKAGGSKKDLGLIDKIWMGSSEELQVLPGGRSSK
ncbi:hypothetical protein CBR_g3031 [Chara braunii]|uniref:Uncharacterized protein n=1 Tax=Chara braunii TaxID=69332 RepID=A0A388KEQ9_CHABU|nr:hypothetical protein CBR_g3031 [Chara braunii]|eukprot:GBG68487.1 hypothetical protein CBR_g3031 [Chara braunii]